MQDIKPDDDLEEHSADWPPTKKRKRRSRWANDDADKIFIPGMPTTLPADATEDQKEQYLLQLQIEESSRKLRSGDLGIPVNPEERSPSPEPIYNNEGKRMNTREYRTRKALEEDRHEKIQKLLALNPSYKPPADYKPPIIRVNDKVMIPQENHPEINFVGLLIGPRGNTLKTLEKETGAKIIIRGKGSVKEGKIGRKDGQPLPGEDEPLHAYITANDPENVKKAVNKIHEIIKEGIEIPEEKNDLRKQQLRELALLNGTLRDNDGLQKLRQIAEAETIITNQIVCTKCGAAGHIARDCVQKSPAELAQAQIVANKGVGDLPVNALVGKQDKAKMDSEYMSLMAELGQVAPDSLKSEMAAKMPSPAVMNDLVTASIASNVAKATADAPVTSTTVPTLSADYGYGGRRSRFDEFDSSNRNRNDWYSKSDNFNGRQNNSQYDPERSRFAQPPRHPPPSRFDHGPPGPPSRFDQGPPAPPSRFDQRPPGAPTRFDHRPPPPGRFDRAPPGFDHPGWNNHHPPPPPQRPNGGMMNSGRWGPPAAVAPPPPPQLAPPAPPPPMPGFGAPPPPPPSSSSWSQPPSNTAPWQNQSSSAAPPPWQNQTSYTGNPAAPPPPPPASSAANYPNYAAAPLPPPPPPQ